MAGRDTSKVIAVGKPRVITDATVTARGGWAATGRVQIPILEGGRPGVATLAFPFRDAMSEREAIDQVLPAFEAVVKQLNAAVARMRGQ